MMDLIRIEPLRRAEGDADLPEPGQVRPDRARRGLVDQNSGSWNRVVLWMRQLETLRRVS